MENKNKGGWRIINIENIKINIDVGDDKIKLILAIGMIVIICILLK
jgi:hypothetical protein